jgi:hypothetical protein
MADVPENLETAARQLWDMAQRVAVQIAEKPPELREEAFGIAERAIKEMASNMGIPDKKVDGFIDAQMKAVRHFVTQIDVGGTPQGGRA